MAPWELKVNYIPMVLGVVFGTGFVTCYLVAVLIGDVSPYVPFISETGGKFPEAGLFSIFLYLGSTTVLSTTFVRYMIVDEMNRGIDTVIDILNKISIVVGFIAVMATVLVASFPMTSIVEVHNISAVTLFFSGTVYAALQTWLSYRMSPSYNGLAICRIRLAVTCVGVLSLVTLLVLMPLAKDEWTNKSHWPGSKVPTDQGFSLMLGSSIAEWCLALSFLSYYFTFVREFGKVRVHVRIEPLVQHFDEEPQDDSERPPLDL